MDVLREAGAMRMSLACSTHTENAPKIATATTTTWKRSKAQKKWVIITPSGESRIEKQMTDKLTSFWIWYNGHLCKVARARSVNCNAQRKLMTYVAVRQPDQQGLEGRRMPMNDGCVALCPKENSSSCITHMRTRKVKSFTRKGIRIQPALSPPPSNHHNRESEPFYYRIWQYWNLSIKIPPIPVTVVSIHNSITAYRWKRVRIQFLDAPKGLTRRIRCNVWSRRSD